MYLILKFLHFFSVYLYSNAYQPSNQKLEESSIVVIDQLYPKIPYRSITTLPYSVKNNFSNNWIQIYFENYSIYLFGILLLFFLAPFLIFLWFFKFLARKCLFWLCRKIIFKCKKKKSTEKIKYGSIISGECGCSIRIRQDLRKNRLSGSTKYYTLLNLMEKNFESEINEPHLKNTRLSFKDNFFRTACILVKLRQKKSTSNMTKCQVKVNKDHLLEKKADSISLENKSIRRLASEEDLSEYSEFIRSLHDIRKEINNLEKLSINV